MVTPFDAANGSLDLDQAKRLATALLDSGTEGLVVCGTTGESPTLSNHEKLALLEATVEVAHARGAPVIAGTTTYNTAESIELSREAAHLGVDGILGTVPVLQQPAAGRAVPALPRDRPRGRPPGDPVQHPVALAAQHGGGHHAAPGARGVRTSSASKKPAPTSSRSARSSRDAPEGFRVWSGNDGDIAHHLALGGYGVVSVAAHLVGRQIAELIAAFISGDTARAAELTTS